ncbi:MAG: hypothetical protein NTX72_01590 [Candidatus Uhrbacteria bacterium]|nr:hypothetical protein [Candidatus Uhrbacteria bacterium]
MLDLLIDAHTHPDPLVFLRMFREDESAYQTLLQMLRFVLHEREIQPPFHVVDVLHRHPFVGGEQLVPGGFPSRIKRPHREARQVVPAVYTDFDPERDLETRRSQLFAMFEEDDDVEDPEARSLRKSMHQFFSYAFSRGDLIACHEPMLFVSGGGFAMREGGFRSHPSVKSIFFVPDLRAQESGKLRRGIKRTPQFSHPC